MGVNTEENCRTDRPVTDAIGDIELVRHLVPPLDLTLLVGVDIQQQSEQQGLHPPLHQGQEHLTPLHHVKPSPLKV